MLIHVAAPVSLARTDLVSMLRRLHVRTATPELLTTLTPDQRNRSVVLVQDAFTPFSQTIIGKRYDV
jgi:hypothetical protein